MKLQKSTYAKTINWTSEGESMSIDISAEKQLQNNTIELLKSMGYIFISQEENISLRDGKLGEVILKDILVKQLQEINSFDYKGITYFLQKKYSKAISDLDESLNEGLMTANAKISDQLIFEIHIKKSLSMELKKKFFF